MMAHFLTLTSHTLTGCVQVCPSECTSGLVPQGGVTMTGVALHMHTAGRSARLQHIRGGRELRPLVERRWVRSLGA